MKRFTSLLRGATASLFDNVRLLTWRSPCDDQGILSSSPCVTTEELGALPAQMQDDVAIRTRLAQAENECNGYKEAYERAATELSRFRDLLRLTERPRGRGRQLVFLHIQKTAGNSVLHFVGRRFEWFQCLQIYSPAEFDAFHPAEINHFDLVCGHMTARNLDAVRPDAFLLTFLREPIDRTLSCYWYFRTYNQHPRDSIRHAVESAKSKSLVEFLMDPTPEVRRHFVNHQAHALAGDWLAPDDRSNTNLLADASCSLDRFHCVGTTESLEEGIGHLCRLIGWPAPSEVVRDNVTPYRERVEDVSPSAVDAIRELTAVDAELYRLAELRTAATLDSVAA